MPRARAKLEGFQELDRQLKQLPKRVAKTVVRKAVTKASTPVLKAMRAAAPVGKTKNLRKAVARRIRSYAQGAAAIVGTRYKRAPHDHLVEDGTAKRSTESGANRGTMPADPFVEPTFESHKTQMFNTLKSELWAGIIAAMKK